MSFLRELVKDASSTVNAVLGDLCIFTNKTGDEREVYVIIDKNIEVFNEYNILAGYRTEATICKDDVEDLLIGCRITDEDQTVYRIDTLMKETLSKYYVGLVVESVS